MTVSFQLLLGLVFVCLANMLGAEEVTAKRDGILAPVVVDGETLFEIRGFKGFSAQTRADRIAERIQLLAEDPFLLTDSITLVSDDITTDVVAGDTIIMSVLDYDAVAEGVSRTELATRLADKIRAAIIKYRQEHSVHNLLIGALSALVATVLLAAFIYGLNRFFEYLRHRLDVAMRRWLDTTRIRIFEFIIEGALIASLKLLRLFILIGGLYVYFSLMLSFFPWTRTIAEKLFGYVINPIKQIGADIWNEMPNLMFLLILFFIVRYLLGVMRFFFTALENGDLQLIEFYPEWAKPTYKISRFLIIIFAIIIAYPYIPGSNSRAFQGVSIFLGVLFSLGSTSVVANMVAGVILTYMRGFRVGDVVKIGDTTGKVLAVSLLVTRIRTPKNLEITIPNSLLMSNQVTNYSFAAGEDRLILPVSITIGYDAPWRQVHGLLLLAAERTEQVLRNPAPFVLQRALDDFYVNYELNAYVGTADSMPKVYSELHQNIQDAFNEYGVQIMSPHYVADPETAKIVTRENWRQAPAADTEL